jgi:hypothetical protein
MSQRLGIACVLVFVMLVDVSVTTAQSCDESTHYWAIGTGDWSNPNNWVHEEWDSEADCILVPGTLPCDGQGCDTYITNGGTAQVMQVGVSAKRLYLGPTSGDSGNLEILSGDLHTGAMWAGYLGTGVITQTGGVYAGADTQSNLFVGYSTNSSGTYNLSGAGQVSIPHAVVGNGGVGSFVQGGTSTTDVSFLVIAEIGSSVGTYELRDSAQLSSDDRQILGLYGDGTFRQYGGTNTCPNVYIGDGVGATGTYELHAGLLNAGEIRLGANGAGTFLHDGGTLAMSGQRLLSIGCWSGSNGTYELSGNGELSALDEEVGWQGTGSFLQSGGTNSVYDLRIGKAAGSEGVYELSDTGQLISGYARIGDSGEGRFTQTGGTHEADSVLIGDDTDGLGTYTISGGTLNTWFLDIGSYGSGKFDIQNAEAQISVSNYLTFGSSGEFVAVPGSVIHVTQYWAEVENYQNDPSKLAGLSHLELVFEGGPGIGEASLFEVAGEDMGAIWAGLVNNYALNTLTLGGIDIGLVRLEDWWDNQPNIPSKEALYVTNLMVGPGSALDLNGYNLYYVNSSIDPTAAILENGGALIPLGTPGDYDDDGDVDLTDYGEFLSCYNGPANPPGAPDCEMADTDGDGDVDLSDYGVFLGCYNGPNNPPACE